MIKQRFVLDEAARLFLDLTARRKWSDVRLSVRGTSLGPPLSRVELRDGQSYTLTDGSELLIRLDTPFFMPTLRIERDGVAVPGSEGSPEGLTAYAGLWLIGLGLLIVLAGFAASGDPKAALMKNALFLTAAFFIVTGFLARRGSFPALALGSGFFFLSVLRGLGTTEWPAVLVQVVILTPMFRAVHAHYLERKGVVRTLRRTDAPLAGVKSVIRPPTEFAETIAPASRPRVAADAAAAPVTSARAEAAPMLPAPAPRPASVQVSQPIASDDGAATSDRSFGSYVVSGTLGSGAMATVYRARQASVGRDVALKVITGNQGADPEFLERFRREAETTAGLSHPHILKVFDYGEDNGRPYLAMEYMSGGTLRGRIAGTQLPVAQVLKWAEQIGHAMDSAHSQGVVHRDIKPENVLLDHNDNAFLADFGLARLSDSTGNLTQAGTQMGSPSYMAPEQWHGTEVTAAADQYAFAAMLFELLCGRPPFVASSLPALMTQHVRGKVPALSEFRPGLPPAVDAFFIRALSKSPNLRFESASALVAAFQASLASVPRTTPTGAVQRPRVPPPTRIAPKAAAPAPSSNVRFWVGLAAIVLVAGGVLQVFRRSRSAESGFAPQTPTAPAGVPVAGVTMAGTMHPLTFQPLSIAFSASLNLIVATVERTNELMIIDPTTARFDQVILGSRGLNVSVSPDGLTAVVSLDGTESVSVVNLATRALAQSVPAYTHGGIATTGNWAYILPNQLNPQLRSINLATADVQIRKEAVPLGVLKVHPSGRRMYLAVPVRPSIRRLETPMGPVTDVLPMKGGPEPYDICGGIWFSERGDYLFTACGKAFSVTDDPATDITPFGEIPGFEHTVQKIRSLSHSEAAGRVVAALTSTTDGFDACNFLTTYRFPGFGQMAREELPKLGSALHPARGDAQFVATSVDGKWVYAIVTTRAQTDGPTAALFVSPLR